MSENADFQASLATFLEMQAGGHGGRHAETEELIAYREGTLAAGEVERLQDHLARCRLCAGLVLDLEDFREPVEPPAEGVTELATATALRAMKTRLSEGEHHRRRPRPPSFAYWQSAIAAALVFAVVGLSAWVARLQGTTGDLRRSLAELAGPGINVPIAYLDPPARRDPAAATLEIGRARFVLVLTPTPPRMARSFEVEILDTGGRELWRGAGLETSEHGTLRLLMSSEVLPPGEYQLRIWGIDGGERLAAGEYSLSLTAGGR